MKKLLYFITNQNGFFLPYVLFIISFVFILITSNITIYNSDLQITERQIEQIKIETLFQMGRLKLEKDIAKYDENDKANYFFPDGHVEILIVDQDGPKYELLFTIETKDNKSLYRMKNFLQMHE